jgi:uncharacterized protein
MPPEVWRPLTELIIGMSAGYRQIVVDFGTGETFLRFEEAMLFLDHLRHFAAGKGIQVQAQITTNGTLVSVGQLRTCVEKQIPLCFSIDGPARHHDAFRRLVDGKPTHRIAMRNWRRYRKLAASQPDAPRCTVSSVVADDARLRDVVRFWRKQGLTRFRAIPASPRWNSADGELLGWQNRRARYLRDLQEIAFSETSRLRGRDLESGYEGPVGILDSWRRLSAAEPYHACGAGYSTIAVDVEGALFPCRGFVGFAERSIGDVHSGVAPVKVADFRSKKSQVQSACRGCWARFLCNSGCCAGDPKAGIVLDTWKGCEFAQSIAEIAIDSYHNWSGHRDEPDANAPLKRGI